MQLSSIWDLRYWRVLRLRVGWLPRAGSSITGAALLSVVTLAASCATLPRLDAVPEPLTEEASVPGIPTADSGSIVTSLRSYRSPRRIWRASARPSNGRVFRSIRCRR